MKNLALTGIRSPDRPASSEWLYRLSYPAQHLSLFRTHAHLWPGDNGAWGQMYRCDFPFTEHVNGRNACQCFELVTVKACDKTETSRRYRKLRTGYSRYWGRAVLWIGNLLLENAGVLLPMNPQRNVLIKQVKRLEDAGTVLMAGGGGGGSHIWHFIVEIRYFVSFVFFLFFLRKLIEI
jgi:hypothetical protein